MPKTIVLSVDDNGRATIVSSTVTPVAATPASITVGSKWVRTGGGTKRVGNNYTVTGTADAGKTVIYAFRGKQTGTATYTIPSDKFLRECTKLAA